MLCAPAQMLAQDVTFENGFSIMPGIFTSDSAPKIYDVIGYDPDEGENTTINVYNDEFKSIATINYNPIKYTSYRAERLINGTWNEYREEYNYLSWIQCNILNLNNDKESVSGTLTQTLFNTDEKFEYILPKYRLVEEVEENDHGYAIVREYYNRIYTTGIDVVSQDGNVVYTFDFGKEYEGQIALSVVLWGDKTYLFVCNYYNSSPYDVYLLKRENLKVSIVKTKELKALKLFPSVAKKESMVTIDLGDKTADNGGMILVTDVNGRTMYTKRVEAGETSLKLPVNGLASGLYVVSLRTPENSFEAAKLVVK